MVECRVCAGECRVCAGEITDVLVCGPVGRSCRFNGTTPFN